MNVASVMDRAPVADMAAAAPAHIALVVAGLDAGGAERVISLLTGEWASRGHRLTLIAFDAPDARIFHPLDPRVEVVRLAIAAGGGGLAGMIATLRRLRALRATLRAVAPDVTIAFLTKISVLTLLANMSGRRPVIVAERNNPQRQRASRLWRLAFRWLAWRADAIVMQSRASVAAIPAARRTRARVIPNPIAIRTTARRSASTPTCAATGRLAHQKGFDLLIAAFSQVAHRHPAWRLTVWGEGEERAALQRQIDACGLGDRIRLPGNSASPEDWIDQSDVFVLPSRFEGFPNVLGEAMAAGLPVAAFDCRYGPADLITPGRDGLLVPDGDVAALAAALDRLFGDEAIRARLGAAARAVADRLRPGAITTEWDEVVAAVTRSGRSPARSS